MTTPNDIPADTELRRAIDSELLEAQAAGSSGQSFPIDETLDRLMQLIKQRDEARDAAIRMDMAERFDGAYLRYLKWEAPTDSEEESIWLTRDELLAELSTPTDQKEKE